MLVNGGKVYFWDIQANDFRLNFDYDETIQYNSPWKSECHENDTGTAIVVIDSISTFVIEHDTVKVQNVSIINNGSLKEEIHTNIYRNIGLKESGIKMPLGLRSCDLNRSIGLLRCFINDTISYNFVDYACDSSWYVTSVYDINNEPTLVYPNPTTGVIKFNDNLDKYQYELYDTTGRLVRKGTLIEPELRLEDKGFFILRYYYINMWRAVKIVVI